MKLSTRVFAACALTLSLGLAHAVELAGIKLDDTVKVAGKELKLNGAGIRTRVVVKVYAMGLYLPEKKDTAEGVLSIAGPRRFTLGMLREVNGEEFGQAFMAGITANTDKAERSKFVNQLAQFGEAFVSLPPLKKNDMLSMDWVPETGTIITLNGKQIGEPLKDVAFYNAVLKIWLGDKPVDSSLKPQLLGGK